MKAALYNLTKTWDARAQCSDCLSFKKKKYLQPHFQYCIFNFMFFDPKFFFHALESPGGLHFISHLQRKLKIFLFLRLRPFQVCVTEEKFIAKLKRKLLNFEQILLKKVLEYKDFSELEFFLIFFSYFSYNPLEEFFTLRQSRPDLCLMQKDEKTHRYFEKFSVRMDSKINQNSCTYNQDGNILALSDNSKIFLFELPSKRFLKKITGNRSGVVALISKFSMIVYQDLKFDLVVFNYLNFVKEFKLKTSNQAPVDYFKVSSNGKYLFAKLVTDKITVWNLLSKRKIFLFYGLGKIDFILHPSGLEIVLFNADAILYDFKTGMHLDTIIKNSKQIDLIFFKTPEKLFYSDINKITLINPQTKEIIKNFENHGFQYLSRDLQVLHSVLGESFDLENLFCSNSKSFNEIVKDDLFSFVSFAHPNIFSRKFKDANGKTKDFPLKFLLEELKFICEDGFIEKAVFNKDKLFVAYSNGKRFFVYVWDCQETAKKLEILDFSGKFSCQFLSCEYLMLQDTQFQYFYNLKTQVSDRFMKIDSDLAVKENLDLEIFTLTKNKKFVVFSNKIEKNFKVIRFSSLNGIFSSKVPPIFNDSCGLMATFEKNEVKVSKFSRNEIISVIPINYEEATFKGLLLVGVDHVCLVFSKKLKIFSMKSNSFVFKTKIKPVSILSQLLIQDSPEWLAFCNETEVVVISLRQFPSKSEFFLADLVKIEKICLKPSLDLLIVIGENKDQIIEARVKTFTVFLIDLQSKNVKQKITESLISSPFLKNEFLFLLHPDKVTSHHLRFHRDTIEANINDYEITLNNSNSHLFYLSKKSQLFIVKAGERIDFKTCPKSDSSLLKISENLQSFAVLDNHRVTLFDSEIEKTCTFTLKNFKASECFLLNERIVVLVSQGLKVLILDALKDFSKVTRFSMKNENIRNLKFVSSGSGDILVYGKNSFCLYRASENLKIMKEFQDIQVLSQFEGILYQEGNGNLKLYRPGTFNSEDVMKGMKNLRIGGVLQKFNKFWIYDQENKVAYIYS